MSSNKIFILILLSLSFVICPLSKAIYSHPDLSKTSKKFETFSIDFKGTLTPPATYWALCNWHMDLTEFKKSHQEVSGGGAYGGLKMTGKSVSTALLSLWKVYYVEDGEKKNITATRMYPDGKETYFRGEGEGSNYNHEYDWSLNTWYRFVIHTWVDSNGDTYVGEWIKDLSNGKWTLFAYFNTHLPNSFLIGGLSQFQENFSLNYFGLERSFQIKNMYVYDKTYLKWISLDTSTLYYDLAKLGHNSAGTHDFGYTNTYFYGSAGLPVDDQELYDARTPEKITGTIKQNENPDFSNPVFKTVDAEAYLEASTLIINWTIDPKSTPCYKYKISIYYKIGSTYKILHSIDIYRPEETQYIYKKNLITGLKGDYQIQLRCYGISHSSVTSILNKQF